MYYLVNNQIKLLSTHINSTYFDNIGQIIHLFALYIILHQFN